MNRVGVTWLRRGGGVLAVLLLLGAFGGRVAAQEGTWSLRAPLPTARTGLAAAVVGDAVYVVGGEDAEGQVLGVVERYDPMRDAWNAAPPLLTPRVNAAAVTLEGRLFVIGGRDAEGEVLEDVEVFNPERGAWEAVEDLDEAREGLAAFVLDGRLYALGGSDDDGRLLTSIEVFDPREQEWETSEVWRLDVARAALAAAATADAAFVFGGFGLLGPVPQVVRFDAAQGLIRLGLLVPPRGALAAVAVRNTIYVIGGRGPLDQPVDDVNALDLDENRWRRVAPLEVPRERFAAVTFGREVYVFGGSGEGRSRRDEVLGSVEMLDTNTSVSILRDGPDVAGPLALHPNYPNPFSGATTFTFDVPEAGPVVLEVFDVHGRLVHRWTPGGLPPGRHTADWDGTDATGRPTPSGAYLVRLRQGGHQATRMMTRIQ